MVKNIISGITPGSIAEELGLKAGDALISINDSEIRDIFDYRFHMADEALSLEVERRNGEVLIIDIEKEEMEDIGLEFAHSLIEEEKSCRNKCVFCFIDQLPKGMRDTLYFKDDDARLSFLYGNYITLTNLSDAEIDRIIRYRMSPVNISVHATNPELRRKMLNNRFAGDVLEKIKRFVQGGITVNCQIVLCPGLNDGEELDRTLGELSELYPEMHSISVVPVGLTRFRDNLYPLASFTGDTARATIRQVEAWQDKLLKQCGSRVVYAADELYLLAGLPLPAYEDYEDFPQIENGVGMVSAFLDEAQSAFSEKQDTRRSISPKTVSIATGLSFGPILQKLAEQLERNAQGLIIKVYPITNRFFGERVTVTGLLTGKDILEQLKGKQLGDELYLCRSMFRAGTETLLDDMSLKDVSENLSVRVRMIDPDGQSFIDALFDQNA